MGDYASWDKSDMMPPSEEEVFIRPSASSIRGAWKDLFSDPLLSLSRLKAIAISKQGLGESDHDGGIILRSVYWRFYHGLLPPPTSLDLFAPSLQAARENYQRLRERYLIAPDGRWADDCTGSEDYHPSRAGPSRHNVAPTRSSASKPRTTYDPLSLDEDSPWKMWYAHLETRKVIMQDVDRTFPDIPYFTLERVRRCMVTMLFLFTVLNPDVGYRQGMHELLAVCLLTVDRDSMSSEIGSSSVMEQAMQSTLDRKYIEHDAFDLFMAIMKPARAFYEWRQEEGPRRAQNVQAPIIVRCNNLHSSVIRRIDPQLWEKLENEGVEAQLWAMRWYKLIFTREIPFGLSLRLWDGIFAEDPGLGILDFIAVAMVLLIRNELLDSDHAGLLTNLLRYPAPSVDHPFSPFLILSQALLLRNSITPTAGVEVVIQNHEVLGVKAQPPVREILQPKPIHRQPPQRGVQGLAAGLFERAQAAGLDKAILSTVADIRRNIPDSAYSYLPKVPFSPSPASRDPSGQFSSIPTSSSVNRTQNVSRPPPPPLTTNSSTESIASRSLVEVERQLAELRLAMVGMGKTMSDILMRLPGNLDDGDKEGLDRIKETLLGAAERDVEEIVKQWGWHDGLESISSRATTPGPEEEEDSVPLTKDIRHGSKINGASTEHPTPSQQDLTVDQSSIPAAPVVAQSPERSLLKAGDSEITPTLPAVSSFSTNNLPTPRLSLSSRLSSATRSISNVPVTAPISGANPYSPIDGQPERRSIQETRPLSHIAHAAGKTEGRGKEFVGSFDPLAGLGVSTHQNNLSKSSRGHTSSVDPLGANAR